MTAPPNQSAEVAVIGAGPAGLMAAIAAADAGAGVTVAERTDAPGSKLLMTGGGRCNITRIMAPDEMAAMFGSEGRFAMPAFEGLPPEGLRSFFSRIGVETVADEAGAVWPRSDSARDVLEALAAECDRLGVATITDSRAESLIIEDGRAAGVDLEGGGRIDAGSVVIATGGASYPATGSSGDGYRLAKAAGHSTRHPVPALVPLVTKEAWPERCAGVAVDGARVTVITSDRKARRGLRAPVTGAVLFTHKGVSGPAVLDLSGDAARLVADGADAAIAIELAPGTTPADWERKIEEWRATRGKSMVRSLVAGSLPTRLAGALVAEACGDGDVKISELPRKGASLLAGTLARIVLDVTGTEGLTKAMATRGGVALKDVDPHTLASRKCEGLYLCGEVVDLDGPCGGYNLQWAFSSGYLAGESAAE